MKTALAFLFLFATACGSSGETPAPSSPALPDFSPFQVEVDNATKNCTYTSSQDDPADGGTIYTFTCATCSIEIFKASNYALIGKCE